MCVCGCTGVLLTQDTKTKVVKGSKPVAVPALTQNVINTLWPELGLVALCYDCFFSLFFAVEFLLEKVRVYAGGVHLQYHGQININYQLIRC